MATVSASLRNSPGQLWQFPVFFLGVAAIIGVGYLRPLWRLTPSERYQRELTPLRHAVDKTPPDVGQVQALLRKVQAAEPPPELLVQTQYLVGSAYMIMAEASTNLEETGQYWELARKYLEAAGDAGIAEADRHRHAFRVAKTWAHTKVETSKVIEALTKLLPGSDDAGEINRVLAEMYLKLKPPDPRKARDCLKEYLARVLPARTELQNRVLSKARLQMGELCVELNDFDEARKVLDRIGLESPPETLIAAKIQIARSYQKESDWNQAIRVWEQAREVKDITPLQKGKILFQLADCYLRAGRKSDALATLNLLRNSGGDEARASALKLAELQLGDSAQRELAVQTLESALPKLASPDQYQNPLLELKAARIIYEQAAESYRLSGQYDLSLRVAGAYAPIAEQGRDRELAAEALEAWGLSLMNPAQIDENDRARTVEMGIKRVREAAADWQALSELKSKPVEQGDYLRRSADLYVKIGDLTEALKTLDLFTTQVRGYPLERMAEFCLQKGELYLKLGNKAQAKIWFENGVRVDEQTAAVLRCRVRLAEMLIQSKDTKNIDKAMADLKKILEDPEIGNEKELHQQTMTLIADALFQQKKFVAAETSYRTVLEHYSQSNYARFQLGYCLYEQAHLEADRCTDAEKVRDNPASSKIQKEEADVKFKQCHSRCLELLKKAAPPFKECEKALQKSGSPLSRDDAILLRRASFFAADCAYYLGDFEEAMRRYDAMTQRYSGSVVQLEAFRQMYECQKFLKNATKAKDLLLQMSTAYVQMPESAFDGSADVCTRDYWSKWFKENQGK